MTTHRACKNLAVLIGRLLIAGVFIAAGVHKIFAFDNLVTEISGIFLPFRHWMLMGIIALQLLGGILVFVGWFTRFGALLLFLFTLLTLIFFHSLWNLTAPITGHIPFQFILNHLALLGATLYIMAYGPGCYSFDGGSCCHRGCGHKKCVEVDHHHSVDHQHPMDHHHQ